MSSPTENIPTLCFPPHLLFLQPGNRREQVMFAYLSFGKQLGGRRILPEAEYAHCDDIESTPKNKQSPSCALVPSHASHLHHLISVTK